MIPSNTDFSVVRHSARTNALQSFEFFANTVLCSSLSEETCQYVQDVLADREDALIRTTRPRVVAIAISTWLQAQGVQVVTGTMLPTSEVLHWLELVGREETSSEACTLDVIVEGVVLRWV